MPRAALRWQPTPRALGGRIDRWGERAEISAIEFAETQATAMTRWMKANAPWADRSGDARAGLGATVERARGQVRVVVAHGVEYGRWLELRWDGRWGILLRTVRRFAPAWAAFYRRGGAR